MNTYKLNPRHHERQTMTKYTDEQIIEAIKKAGGKKHPGTVYAWELSMYKKVLDALPEPQDDWVECAFEDIQKGDRVKLVCKVGQLGGSPSVVEVDPDVVNPEYITWARNNNLGIIEKEDVQTVYRIPTPVQHPDPLERPVIIVHKTGTVIWNERPAYWNPEEREYVFQDAFCTAFLPDDITEWEPAIIAPKAQKEVVEDDR